MREPSIIAFGDNVVDCYAEQSLMYPGGNCLNVSVFARRFGCDSAYAGAVADDPAGRHIKTALAEEGVDLAGLRIEAGRTAFCIIETVDGERSFIGADLGVSIIAPETGDFERMARSDAVHTGRSSHVHRWLPEMARRTRVSFDLATVHDRGRVRQVAPHCFLLSLSGDGLDTEAIHDLSKEARSAGANWVLVTRGARGAFLSGPQGFFHGSADPIRPLDTLGAGDTFIARTLVGLLRQEQPEALLRAAAQEAASTCMHHGAFGHGKPMEIDRDRAKSLAEIYASTEAPDIAKSETT